MKNDQTTSNSIEPLATARLYGTMPLLRSGDAQAGRSHAALSSQRGTAPTASTVLSTTASIISLLEAFEQSAVSVATIGHGQDSRTHLEGRCCCPRGTTSADWIMSATMCGESMLSTQPHKSTLVTSSHECGKWTCQAASHADKACEAGGHWTDCHRAKIWPTGPFQVPSIFNSLLYVPIRARDEGF